MSSTQFYGTGRRKTSVARVFLRPGKGEVTVNRRPLEDYFPLDAHQTEVLRPLRLVEQDGKFNLLVTVRGGGLTGQAQAIRHGVARALLEVDPEFRPALKEQGLLTRDSRMKERKKYGQRGARARFQFSKR